jgi:hypothetical protein
MAPVVKWLPSSIDLSYRSRDIDKKAVSHQIRAKSTAKPTIAGLVDLAPWLELSHAFSWAGNLGSGKSNAGNDRLVFGNTT